MEDITFQKMSFLWGNFNRRAILTFDAFFEASILKKVRILCVISTIAVWC